MIFKLSFWDFQEQNYFSTLHPLWNEREWVCSADLSDAGHGFKAVKGPDALISPLQAWSSRPWCSSSASWSPSSSLSCPSCTDRIWSSFRSSWACGENRHSSYLLKISVHRPHDHGMNFSCYDAVMIAQFNGYEVTQLGFGQLPYKL